MINERRYLVTGMFILTVVLLTINFVSAEPIIDPEVEELLQNQSEVNVFVELKTNISSSYSPSIQNSEERAKWLEDIMKQVDEVQAKVIPNLSESEFKIKYIFELSPSFSGNLTKEGLEKLRNNPNVRSITKVEKIYGTSLENQIFEGSINCHEDADCVVVSLTCCGCQTASIDIPIHNLLTSINKIYLARWNENFEETCQNTICGQGANEEQAKKCSSYKPKCINNLCGLIDVFEEENDNQTQTQEEVSDATATEEKSNLWTWIVIIIVGVVVIIYIIARTNKKH